MGDVGTPDRAWRIEEAVGVPTNRVPFLRWYALRRVFATDLLGHRDGDRLGSEQGQAFIQITLPPGVWPAAILVVFLFVPETGWRTELDRSRDNLPWTAGCGIVARTGQGIRLDARVRHCGA